jgi:hypothetical protein
MMMLKFRVPFRVNLKRTRRQLPGGRRPRPAQGVTVPEIMYGAPRRARNGANGQLELFNLNSTLVTSTRGRRLGRVTDYFSSWLCVRPSCRDLHARDRFLLLSLRRLFDADRRVSSPVSPRRARQRGEQGAFGKCRKIGRPASHVFPGLSADVFVEFP